MSSLLFYFLQVVICSGILYAYYYVALRNKKFHLYNRYYLLIAVILSILIPVINIPVYLSGGAVKVPGIMQSLTALSSVAHGRSFELPAGSGLAQTSFTTENILRFSYLLIAFALFIRFILAIVFIGKLLRRYKVEQTADIYFVNTSEPGTPFSFFRWLFWNNKIDLRSENGQYMFRHELFHIRQKHSWDLACMEIINAVFWINPFFHLIKRELRTIHEFLADEFATKEHDKWNYAEALLVQVLDSSDTRLVSPFFQNQIKRRIAMITSSKTPKYQFFRKLMILPVSILVFALFGFKIKRYAEFHFSRSQAVISNIDQGLLASTSYAPVSDTTKPKAKQKKKGNVQQKEADQKNIDNENEAMEFKRLMEAKQLEMQKAQQEFQMIMMERQKEDQKAQEEFRKLMETRQGEARAEGQERLKLLMEERQREVEKYQEELKKMMAMRQKDAEKNQEEFKKMMDARQREAEQKGQETFKQLMEERQKQAGKYEDEYRKMMTMRQKETEKSQEEFRKSLQQRQQEMQKMQEEFEKRMLEKNKKQLI